MIKCILVDDEKIILDDLCAMLNASKGIKLLSAYTDPYEALEGIQNMKPDAVFLDIEMPELNGIELSKKIAAFNSDIQIIFVTAYEQYALKAFEVSAVHYLLKPLTSEKLQEAIDRVHRVIKINTNSGSIQEPSFVKGKSGAVERISVKDRDSVFVIKVADILYFESEGGKTDIVTKSGSYTSRLGLQFWEKKLYDDDFIRCHRSFVVNANYISKMIHVLGKHKELVLDYCDINIPISRQKLNTMKQWLGII